MTYFNDLYAHYNRAVVDDSVRVVLVQGDIPLSLGANLIPLMQYLEELCFLPVLYSMLSPFRMALTIKQVSKQHMIRIVIPFFKARCREYKITCYVETGPETFGKDCWPENPITDYVLSINF